MSRIDEREKINQDGWKGLEIHRIKNYESFNRFKQAVKRTFKGVMGHDEDWTSSNVGKLQTRKLPDEKWAELGTLKLRNMYDEEFKAFREREKEVPETVFCDPVEYGKDWKGEGESHHSQIGLCHYTLGEVSCDLDDECYRRGWDIRWDEAGKEGHIYMYYLEGKSKNRRRATSKVYKGQGL